MPNTTFARTFHIAQYSGSIFSLLIANLVPLYGVLFKSWNIFSIMILYWLESAVIGFFTIQKIRKAEGTIFPRTSTILVTPTKDTPKPDPSLLDSRGFYIPFFTLHYGIFMFVHLVFLLLFFGPLSFIPRSENTHLDLLGVLIGFTSLGASHTFSYYSNFIQKGEYKIATPEKLFFAPYPRILIMHLTVIVGGIAVMSTGQTVTGLTLLVISKTIVDLVSHVIEHRHTV